MSESIGVTQALELNPDPVQQASKRKPDSSPLDGSNDDPRRNSKNPRLDNDQNDHSGHDASVENGGKEKVTEKGVAEMVVREEEKETDKKVDHSTGVLVDKGKGKMVMQEKEVEGDRNPNPSPKPFVDKGKGKMIVEEEEEDSSDDSDDAGVASGSDSDYSDDPLMEVDLNNILPSRTRRWNPPAPGAYLVPPGQDEDEDEDDDDDDAIDDGVDDDDDDDDSESE